MMSSSIFKMLAVALVMALASHSAGAEEVIRVDSASASDDQVSLPGGRRALLHRSRGGKPSPPPPAKKKTNNKSNKKVTFAAGGVKTVSTVEHKGTSGNAETRIDVAADAATQSRKGATAAAGQAMSAATVKNGAAIAAGLADYYKTEGPGGSSSTVGASSTSATTNGEADAYGLAGAAAERKGVVVAGGSEAEAAAVGSKRAEASVSVSATALEGRVTGVVTHGQASAEFEAEKGEKGGASVRSTSTTGDDSVSGAATVTGESGNIEIETYSMTILTGGTPVNGVPTSQTVTRIITSKRDKDGNKVVLKDEMKRSAVGPDGCANGACP